MPEPHVKVPEIELSPPILNIPAAMVIVPLPDRLPDIVKVLAPIDNVGVLGAAILIETSETL